MMQRWRSLSASGPAAIAVLLLLATAAGAIAWNLRSQMHAVEDQIASLRSAKGSSAKLPAASAAPDFTAVLPRDIAGDVILDRCMQSAIRQGLRVKASSVAARSDSLEALPRVDLAFEVQGSYAAIKSWLNDTVTRGQGIAISEIALRRVDGVPTAGVQPTANANQPAEVSATVKIRVFGRPKDGRS